MLLPKSRQKGTVKEINTKCIFNNIQKLNEQKDRFYCFFLYLLNLEVTS